VQAGDIIADGPPSTEQGELALGQECAVVAFMPWKATFSRFDPDFLSNAHRLG